MPFSEEKITVLRELGQEIRARREDFGFSFDDVYQRTRLQPVYLDAIENANYEMLPDTVYTLGFIRTYLGVLRFDELYPEFRHWLLKNTRAAVNPGVVGSYEPPTAGFKLASRFWIFVVLLLIIFGAMTYAVYSFSEKGFPNVAARNGQRTENTNGQAVPAVSADISGDMRSGDLSADVSVTTVPATEPKKPELVIVANDDCWISIRVGNGKIADRTLKKGETYTMELTARTRVHYGRPWAVNIIHNGRDIGTPYKSGVKRQQVNFYDPDGKSGRIEAGQRSQ